MAFTFVLVEMFGPYALLVYTNSQISEKSFQLPEIKISILCAAPGSNYYFIPGLDIWPKSRNAYKFTGTNKVICHPPCAQWSKLKSFSIQNDSDKKLALFCWEVVNKNGGIFEHPVGSCFFKYVNADFRKIITVNQNWFGFPARKNTFLYFHNCKPTQFPISISPALRTVESLHSKNRSITTFKFNKFLVDSIRQECGN